MVRKNFNSTSKNYHLGFLLQVSTYGPYYKKKQELKTWGINPCIYFNKEELFLYQHVTIYHELKVETRRNKALFTAGVIDQCKQQEYRTALHEICTLSFFMKALRHEICTCIWDIWSQYCLSDRYKHQHREMFLHLIC